MKNLGLIIINMFVLALPVIAEVDDTFGSDMPLDNILSHGTMHETDVLRALLSLLIVIGLIYLTAWMYKKLNIFNSSKLVKNDKSLNLNKFKVISTQSLGANKNLHVVEINGKYLVLGSTANSINLIKEFDKELTSVSHPEEYGNDLIVEELLNKYEEEKKDAEDRQQD